jgi:ribonuclease HI
MSHTNSITIFSDGGGERSSSAAAACIIEIDAQRLQFVAFLGPATNNEAEIFGGLLAFSALPLVLKKDVRPALRWVCDSEYVLKSATEYIHNWQRNGWKTAAKKPVKNQAMWRAYSMLSQGMKVTAEHIYGHTGHAENEACDSAATWARANGEQLLRQSGNGLVLSGLPGHAHGQWRLIEGRGYLTTLRQAEEREVLDEEILQLRTELAQLEAAPEAVMKESAEDRAKREFDAICARLVAVVKELAPLERHLDEAKQLRGEATKLLKTYQR